MRFLQRAALVLAFGSSLLPVLAQEPDCTLADPNTPRCVRGGRTPAMQPTVPTALPAPATPPAAAPPSMVRGPFGGYYARPDGYVCGVYDKASKRCLVRESTEEERESAYRTGVEAATNSMKILNEINRRQGLPVAPLPRAAGPQQEAIPISLQGAPGQTAEQCAADARQRFIRAANRAPTNSEMITLITGCSPE